MFIKKLSIRLLSLQGNWLFGIFNDMKMRFHKKWQTVVGRIIMNLSGMLE